MDEQLKSIIIDRPDARTVIEFSNPATGEVRLLPSPTATSGQTHTLKPLAELYGAGTGLESVELTDDRFMPLLMSIEETFVDAFRADHSLSDGAVLTALDRLCMTPEADVRNDRLALSVQAGLRLTLSLNDYSRQDVRHALRKVKQSVARHTRLAGTQGYLTFIRQQLGRGG